MVRKEKMRLVIRPPASCSLILAGFLGLSSSALLGQGAGLTAGDDPSLDLEEFRSIDGFGNNLSAPEWGSTGRDHEGITLRRLAGRDGRRRVDLADGNRLDNPRRISNLLGQQPQGLPSNGRGVNDFFWIWGQFLDHDITLTPQASDDPAPIFVPLGDPWFDPRQTGQAEISFNRSEAILRFGNLEQLNRITAFIDGSQVYGSDERRARALRRLDGTGRLRVSQGDLLPFDDGELENDPGPARGPVFLAGDIRANEHIGLTAMHTLFVREHNYIARLLRQSDASLSGDEIYQRARMIVGAEIQKITYEEFLPLLLGQPLRPYRGYQENVDPSISNEFATAAFRFGHSMVSPQLLLRDRDGRVAGQGQLALRDVFFNPMLLRSLNIADLLRGLSLQAAQKLDIHLIDDLRNMLFGAPGSGGLDLFSLNIQRGRDHELPSYNQARRAYGLRPVADFLDRGRNGLGVTRDRLVADRLRQIYGSVENIDLWVGGLLETVRGRALIGELFTAIIRDQFERLRDGDRFYYERVFKSGFWAEFIRERASLAAIVRRNSGVGNELGEVAMLVQTGDSNPDQPDQPEGPGHDDTSGVETDFQRLERLCDEAKSGRFDLETFREIARLLQAFELSRCEDLP